MAGWQQRNRTRFMAIWEPRIGERAAGQQFLAQWLVSIGALAVVGWIALAILGHAAHSSVLNTLSVFVEVVSFVLIGIGLVVFLVSRKNRTKR
jgi:hypothetical protein